jgi:hypothetical protein
MVLKFLSLGVAKKSRADRLAMACHAAVAKGESGKVTWEIITAPLGRGDGPPGRSFQEFLKSEEASFSRGTRGLGHKK